jgi:hypothetical protein
MIWCASSDRDRNYSRGVLWRDGVGLIAKQLLGNGRYRGVRIRPAGFEEANPCGGVAAKGNQDQGRDALRMVLIGYYLGKRRERVLSDRGACEQCVGCCIWRVGIVNDRAQRRQCRRSIRSEQLEPITCQLNACNRAEWEEELSDGPGEGSNCSIKLIPEPVTFGIRPDLVHKPRKSICTNLLHCIGGFFLVCLGTSRLCVDFKPGVQGSSLIDRPVVTRSYRDHSDAQADCCEKDDKNKPSAHR